MTKADIAGKVQEKMDLTGKQASEVVDTVFEMVKEALAAGHDIKINGFGNFSVKDRAARQGKNPKTGERITIAASRAVAFKPGKALKDNINMQP